WSYSGGGYSIMEKVVEDVSGMPLEAYFEQHIAGPLGMTRSRFEQPLPDQLHTNASSGHSRRGKVIAGGWRNYPEQAAAGLWTTPADLAKYCIEVYEIYNGKTNGILQPTTIELMLTEEMGHWGLGPELGNSSQQNKVFKHNGSNEGFKTQFIAFADSGNAVVILTNGEKGYSLVLEILMGLEAYYGWDLL
ncbi:MAG: serine hydrolase domain-containing protein, partial [Bacteroidota bacterium]